MVEFPVMCQKLSTVPRAESTLWVVLRSSLGRRRYGTAQRATYWGGLRGAATRAPCALGTVPAMEGRRIIACAATLALARAWLGLALGGRPSERMSVLYVRIPVAGGSGCQGRLFLGMCQAVYGTDQGYESCCIRYTLAYAIALVAYVCVVCRDRRMSRRYRGARGEAWEGYIMRS